MANNDTAFDVLTSLNLVGKPCTPETGEENFDIMQIVEAILKLACALSEKWLYEYQQQFFRRVCEAILLHKGDMLTGLWSRQSGKTETIGCIVSSCMLILPELAKQFPNDWRLNITDELGRYRGFKNGINFGIYAPILDQSQIMHERIRSMFETPGAVSVMNELGVKHSVNRGNIVVLDNGSSCLAMSASKNSKIEGHTHHVVVAEECQDIDAQKIRKCFAEGTKVITTGGVYAPIERVVQEGLPVATPEGLMIPSAFHDNGVQKVYEVTTDEGRKLRVTANHQHPVRWRGMKRAYVRKQTWELEIGWQLAVPDATPVFGEEGSLEEGFLLGVMLGDGCFAGDKPLLIADERTLARLKPAVEAKGATIKRYSVHSNGMVECGLTKPEGGNKLNPLTQWFRDLGVWGSKGSVKHVPNREWSEDFLRGLVEGLICTDGCVEASDCKPVISFANISESLVDYLQDSLLKFGIHATKHSRFQKGSRSLPGLKNYEGSWLHVLHIKGVEDIRRFHAHFCLPNKQDKLNAAAITVGTTAGRNSSQAYNSATRFARIKDVRFVGELPTYCVTVPTEEHLLVAEGVLSSNSIHPMIASTKGMIVKIGTAGTVKGDFHASIRYNKRMEVVKGVHNHFFFPQQVCSKYNSMYRDYIEEEKLRIGEYSDEFKMAYCCEWMLERGMFVIDKYLMASGVALTEGKYSKIYNEGFRGTNLVVGIDLGKETDSTVLTICDVDWSEPTIQETIVRNFKETEFIAYTKHVVAWKEFQGDDYEFQYQEILEWLSHFSPIRKIVLDATREASFADRVAHAASLKDAEVEDFIFSLQSKAAGFRLWHGDLLARRFTFPAGTEARQKVEYRRFVSQTLDLVKSYAGEYLVVGHPEEQGAHDDYCCSAMLANWGANKPTTDMMIEQFSGNAFV